MRLMTEMNASFQQLAHAEVGQRHFTSPVSLRGPSQAFAQHRMPACLQASESACEMGGCIAMQAPHGKARYAGIGNSHFSSKCIARITAEKTDSSNAKYSRGEIRVCGFSPGPNAQLMFFSGSVNK